MLRKQRKVAAYPKLDVTLGGGALIHRNDKAAIGGLAAQVEFDGIKSFEDAPSRGMADSQAYIPAAEAESAAANCPRRPVDDEDHFREGSGGPSRATGIQTADAKIAGGGCVVSREPPQQGCASGNETWWRWLSEPTLFKSNDPVSGISASEGSSSPLHRFDEKEEEGLDALVGYLQRNGRQMLLMQFWAAPRHTRDFVL